MNKFLSAFLILIAFLTLSTCSPNGKIPPRAVKGVLDLKDWELDRDGSIYLDGEW